MRESVQTSSEPEENPAVIITMLRKAGVTVLKMCELRTIKLLKLVILSSVPAQP